eukprot:IDg16756t1
MRPYSGDPFAGAHHASKVATHANSVRSLWYCTASPVKRVFFSAPTNSAYGTNGSHKQIEAICGRDIACGPVCTDPHGSKKEWTAITADRSAVLTEAWHSSITDIYFQ